MVDTLSELLGIFCDQMPDFSKNRADGDDITLYDPACGSGSLLIRAAEVAPVDVAICGQERVGTTAGLARMNLVLHNRATAEIKGEKMSAMLDELIKARREGAIAYDKMLTKYVELVMNTEASKNNPRYPESIRQAVR